MINAKISDGQGTNATARVIESKGDCNALVVAQRPLKTFTHKRAFFTSDTYGTDMNINPTFGGTPEPVHNGIDNVYWTGSQPVGGTDIDFHRADRPHTGTYSVRFNDLEVGDIGQFAKGSSFDLSGYTALTFWINVDRRWKTNDSVEIYGYASGQVGDIVYLEDYCTPTSYDVWQKVVIPLTDMNLQASSVDAFRFRCAAIDGDKPRWFLDDFQIEETGTIGQFIAEPREGTWWHTQRMLIQYVDAYTSSGYSGMPDIPYDSLFGVAALSSGISIQFIHDGQVVDSALVNQHSDFMQLSNAKINGYGCDGTNSWVLITLNFDNVVLKSEVNDYMIVTITDDLSGLKLLRISLEGYEEVRNVC